MQKDVLYLACTRGPQAWLGLPAEAWFISIYTCYLGFMVIGDAHLMEFRGYSWGIIFACIMLGMRKAVDKDPNIFRIFRLLLETFSLFPVMWGAPHRFPRRAKRMISGI